ncbi:MAG TPA: HNH endonuclease signature motif containing protein [Micromonosporaceae bacterium]|nr:HNH endonuclease signature motif containing protein [Micromonosporaceae bacterium]
MARVVVAQNGCWLWGGAIQSKGYGAFGYGGKGKSVLAHRWSYVTFVGPVPQGMQVDHLCHNRDLDCPGGKCAHRLCVRPDHLEPVTNEVNSRRGAVGRKSHCVQGHRYTAANTIRKRNGARNCRECQVAWTRAWRQRQLTTTAPT